MTDQGTVYCWGHNDASQLGSATTEATYQFRPVPVDGLDDVVGISVGNQHGCSVRATGAVSCWGWNSFRQLGEAGPSRAEPRDVVGLSDVTAVAAGWKHNCALTGAGEVFCWGDNMNGPAR